MIVVVRLSGCVLCRYCGVRQAVTNSTHRAAVCSELVRSLSVKVLLAESQRSDLVTAADTHNAPHLTTHAFVPTTASLRLFAAATTATFVLHNSSSSCCWSAFDRVARCPVVFDQ